jgi:hypothetical protein
VASCGARATGGGRHTAGKLQWRAILAGGSKEDDPEADTDHPLKVDQVAACGERGYKLLHLPSLTYEQLAIPLRVAFALKFVASPAMTVLRRR